MQRQLLGREENGVRPKPKPALLPQQAMATMAKPGALTPLHSHLNELPLVDLSSIHTKLKVSVSHSSYPIVTLKRLRNASILPVIRAQTSAGMEVGFLFLYWEKM